MLILDLWGISFHAVGVFGLGNDLLFKSVLGHCDMLLPNSLKKSRIVSNSYPPVALFLSKRQVRPLASHLHHKRWPFRWSFYRLDYQFCPKISLLIHLRTTDTQRLSP
jgi:hypothetical protein